MKDDLRYTPTDCFETFPFPENWEQDEALEASGQAYYEFRAALMVRNNQGLTDTYNRFHDPEEGDAGILELRRLHGKLDDAVLRAYGWTDLLEGIHGQGTPGQGTPGQGTPGQGTPGQGTPGQGKPCYIRLDYEDAAEEGSRRRKPWRYRWSDDFRGKCGGEGAPDRSQGGLCLRYGCRDAPGCLPRGKEGEAGKEGRPDPGHVWEERVTETGA